MHELVRIMSMPYVGPMVVILLSFISAWIMVTLQRHLHPEDFSNNSDKS